MLGAREDTEMTQPQIAPSLNSQSQTQTPKITTGQEQSQDKETAGWCS